MILVMFKHCLSKNDISMKSVYISIKSVSKAYIIEHYQFSITKSNRFEGQNMGGGGGIKDMLSPPCQNMGGYIPPPEIYVLDSNIVVVYIHDTAIQLHLYVTINSPSNNNSSSYSYCKFSYSLNKYNCVLVLVLVHTQDGSLGA